MPIRAHWVSVQDIYQGKPCWGWSSAKKAAKDGFQAPFGAAIGQHFSATPAQQHGYEEEQDQGSPDGGQDEQHTKDTNKKDVERLLDSMKQSEKNLQLWRFQQRKASKSRKDHATKDW